MEIITNVVRYSFIFILGTVNKFQACLVERNLSKEKEDYVQSLLIKSLVIGLTLVSRSISVL